VRSQQNEVGLREKVNFPKTLALGNKGVDYHSGGSELVPFGGAPDRCRFFTARRS